MKKQITIVACILAIMFAGCNETQQVKPTVGADIKPLIQHLMPIPEEHKEWENAYGADMESRMVFVLAVLQENSKTLFENDLKIGEFIQSVHPAPDPNVPTLESRVEELEDVRAAIDRALDNLLREAELEIAENELAKESAVCRTVIEIDVLPDPNDDVCMDVDGWLNCQFCNVCLTCANPTSANNVNMKFVCWRCYQEHVADNPNITLQLR